MSDEGREDQRSETPFAPTTTGEEEIGLAQPTSMLSPRSIGRYELVYELGQGGMATVYLARIRGPGGFLKWVAIKTIHGHMSTESRINDMFLDEARIAASIQHPNVVQLLDFGQEQRELYIAMEYIHGEHLRVVSDAAQAHFGSFPHSLAAYIVAETARGLHHAHESKDATGEPLALVHRDVSPQNIIVTYDGQVKLTDFGVAKTANRISKTISGRVKGKWAYMAPEQVLGEPIDHRADIFSLGTVLWEITTGVRLFKAESEVRTVMRITSGRTPTPSSVVPGFPEKLERVVMRALSRRPADRYESAAAMAQELDEFTALSGQPVGKDALAEIMESVFAKRIALKEELLRQEASKTLDDVGHRPTEPTSIEVPTESLEAPPLDTIEEGLVRKRPLGLAVAVSLLIVVAIAFLAGVFLLDDGKVDVHLSSQPSGATVILDGVVQPGSTPTVIRGIERGRHDVELRLQGFQLLQTTFDAESSRVELSYHMREVESGRPPQSTVEHTVSPAPDSGITKTVDASTEAGAVAAHLSGDASGEAAGTKLSKPGKTKSAVRTRGVAYLNLLARPWAKVWINGRVAGQTPLMRHPVPAGSIVVRLQAEGRGEVRTIRVQAEPGETVSRQVSF